MIASYGKFPIVSAAAIAAGLAVKNTSGTVAVCSTAGTDIVLGILAQQSTAAGQKVSWVRDGYCLAQTSAAVTAGQKLVADADGKLKPFVPGDFTNGATVYIVGTAADTNGAAGWAGVNVNVTPIEINTQA